MNVSLYRGMAYTLNGSSTNRDISKLTVIVYTHHLGRGSTMLKLLVDKYTPTHISPHSHVLYYVKDAVISFILSGTVIKSIY